MAEKDLERDSQEITKRNDFIEIEFTGYANGEIFDSNVEEDLKKIDGKAKPEKMIVVIGQGMVVKGLDNALEGKEFNKSYEVSFSYREGFGERNRSLIRVMPLSAFSEQKVYPQPGMVFALDQHLVKIIAVSGARVTADFNNPLAGKDIRYRFKILKKVEEKKDKAETLFKLFFKFIPEFEIKENNVVVKLPKGLESMISHISEKFKEISGMELSFQELKKNEDDLDKESREKTADSDKKEKQPLSE